ncbi:MAG: 30S ribosomal protein S16, partial [Candidatus Marinimicrobia bacterium]|nr:30S ribosomal protein S16 [Candidatus Neomarinimicrobiota bacterium]
MSTKIRLKRIGRRNKPFYRVVVMDSRKKRDGASIEELGWYNPVAGKSEQDYSLKEDRILYWLNEGAQITDIVHHLFKREGIAHKWHLMKQGLDEASIEKEMQKWALDRTEVEKRKKAKIKLGKKAKAKQKKLTEEPAEETIEAVADSKEEETLEEVPTEKGK